MTQLPTSHTVASLICEAALNMWGVPVDAVEAAVRSSPAAVADRMRSHTVLLQMNGAEEVAVNVSADRAGGAALGRVMFCCFGREVSDRMIDDALGELGKIVATQLQALMASVPTLGLPTALACEQGFHRCERSETRLRVRGEDGTVCVTVAPAPVQRIEGRSHDSWRTPAQ